jgi:hypothetical protein
MNGVGYLRDKKAWGVSEAYNKVIQQLSNEMRIRSFFESDKDPKTNS